MAKKQVALNSESMAEQYLLKPYARLIIPEDDGSFRGEIVEFSGCIAAGGTAAETVDRLEKVAKNWLISAIDLNQPIPNPVESSPGFSGKLVLRLPKSLHKKASWFAELEKVSLNQFIVTSLAITLGEKQILHSIGKIVNVSATFNMTNVISQASLVQANPTNVFSVLSNSTVLQHA